MTQSVEHAVRAASLLMKFALFTERQKVLGRQVLMCLGCERSETCAAGRAFIAEPGSLPVCPKLAN